MSALYAFENVIYLGYTVGMNKRLAAYIAVGTIVVVTFELILEGIQYTNPPDWFYPIWMIIVILFQFIALPAHILTSSIVSLLPTSLQPPILPKPTLAELGSLYTTILLFCDAIEGALLGWLFFFVKNRMGENNRLLYNRYLYGGRRKT